MSQPTLTDSILAEIAEKTGGQLSQSMVWRQAAERAINSGVSQEATLELARSLSSARFLDHLVESARRVGARLDDFLAAFATEVDDSQFAAPAWWRAAEAVWTLTLKENRFVDPITVLGYVSCSEAAANADSAASLAEVVQEMLDRYGFDG